jgi:hypothetical protein
MLWILVDMSHAVIGGYENKNDAAGTRQGVKLCL